MFLGHVRGVVAEGHLDETFVDAGPDQCSPPELYTYGGLIAHVLTFAALGGRSSSVPSRQRAFRDLGYGDPRKWVTEPV